MEDVPNPLSRFGDFVLRWRWPVLFAFSLLAVAAELLEHAGTGPESMEPDFYPELIFFGLILPIAAGLLLTEISHARRRAGINLANAIDAERYRLSRDVHDSLAQQVTYLHLKLDQFASHRDSLDAAAAQHQLQQMQEVADDAFRQIYNMMALLRTPASAELTTVLERHAKRMASRASFELAYSCTGQAQKLPPNQQQQVLYIFGEILSNVEKHAKASRVEVSLKWQAASLTVEVCDDGLGFAPEDVSAREHYGLAVMRERAGDIGGELDIESQPGVGTTVRLYVPFATKPSEQYMRVLERAAQQERAGFDAT